MRKFATEVIKFLNETYQDAFKYEIAINTGISYRDSLELNVISNHIRIYVPPKQMFRIYNMYKHGDDIWKLLLQELIDD